MLAKYTLLFLLASSLSVTAVFTPYISQIHPNGDKKMCIQPSGSGSAADVIRFVSTAATSHHSTHAHDACSAPCRRSREQLWLVGANSRCQNLKNGGCLNAGGRKSNNMHPCISLNAVCIQQRPNRARIIISRRSCPSIRKVRH